MYYYGTNVFADRWIDWTAGNISFEWQDDGSLHITSNGEAVMIPILLYVLYDKSSLPDWLTPGDTYFYSQDPDDFTVTIKVGSADTITLADGYVTLPDDDGNTRIGLSIPFTRGEPVDRTIRFELYEVIEMSGTYTTTASNVSVGKPNVIGGIYRAPKGTALPSNAVDTLASSYVSLGYIAEGGVENNFSTESEVYRAWGGDIVLVYSTGTTDTFAFGMIETIANEEVQKVWFGDENVSGALATGITARANAQDLEEAVYVIDMTLRGGVLRRIVIPDGKLTERGAVTYEDEEVISYPATITAMAGSDGDTHKEYTQSPAST